MRRLLTTAILLAFGFGLAGCSGASDASSTTTTVASVSPTSGASSAAWKTPEPGSSFDYFLSVSPGTVGTGEVVVLDGEYTPISDVQAVHERDAYAVCYMNGGAWEPYRTDSDQFSEAVKGKVMEGWADEKWFDVRDPELLPIMKARVVECKAKGFDGVEFDNMDGYLHDSGFPLTQEDQIAYAQKLAGLAHEAGLGAALKNGVDMIPSLVGSFDFAINEQCIEFEECAVYQPFVAAKKAVFNVEYVDRPDRCEIAKENGIVSIFARLEVDGPGVGCP